MYKLLIVSTSDDPLSYSLLDKKINDIIEVLNLRGLENKLPNEISGGQQQRVAFARIIVNEPDFLLLDEPFSALDAFLKWNLVKELKNIVDKLGKKAIFVTHNINEVYYLCKNAIVLDSGKCVGIGTHKELLNSCEVYRQIALSQLSKEELENA